MEVSSMEEFSTWKEVKEKTAFTYFRNERGTAGTKTKRQN